MPPAVQIDIPALLKSICEKSVEVWLEQDRLAFRDSRNVLSETEIQLFREFEPDIVAELQRGEFITQSFPLSYGQKSLWFMHQTMKDSPAYNIALAVRIACPLDVVLLRASLQSLLNRHASLRTTFSVGEDGELSQHVFAYRPLSFVQIDISGRTDQDVKQDLTSAYKQPFDLFAGPLMRAHLYTNGNERNVLLLTIHHIVFDGPSMFTFLTELQDLYANELLRPIKHSYRAFVEWQLEMFSGPEGKAHVEYWRERLKGSVHILDVPADHPRSSKFSGRGGSVVFGLSDETMGKLRGLAQEQGVRLFDILVSAYQVLLYRYSGQQDLLIGFLTSGRPQVRFAKLSGLFINPIILRAMFASNPTFLGFLKVQSDQLTESLKHQHLPFLKLVENLQVTRSPGYVPLIQVLFNYFKIPRTAQFAELFVTGHEPEQVVSPGLVMESYGLNQDDGEFDLVLEIAEGRRCWGRFKYNADLFDRRTIERITAQYQNLLQSIVESPSRAVASLPLLTEADREQLLLTWNDTQADVPQNTCIQELFVTQAAKTPDRVAVVCGKRQLTYGELNRDANILAHHLIRRGVGPEVLVAVCLERSVEMVVALLAVLKAGGAYVPLDPHFPKARLDLILEDARPQIVLTQSEVVHALGEDAGDPPQVSEGSDLAYVIYTSGSTGKPKGVQIPHSALTNFLLSMRKRPGLTEHDILLAVTTISFDIAGLELWLPLTAGARVVIATREMTIDGRQLANAISSYGVTIMQATPATWRLLLDSGWSGSNTLKALCGGEALARDLANQLLRHTGSLWNMYGPTETTVWSTIHQVQPGEELIPLGTPIDNTTLYIVDANLEPVPLGVTGELLIGGAGLARAYSNRDDLTASKFVPNPFTGASGERLYRTGDVCQGRADGSIAFLGRLDDQVKIRGHRIELGDIETTLLRHSKVHQAVVVAHDDPSAGKRLVAYFTGHATNGDVSGSVLREYLAKELPDYMVPSAFVFLEALPLTPNNKIDRKSLQSLSAPQSSIRRTHKAPRTKTERAVAGLWAEMLNLPEVGVDDRFDEAGGDSLSFALMILRLSRLLKIELPVRMDDQMLTVAGLAMVIDEARKATKTSKAIANGPSVTAEKSSLGQVLVRACSIAVRLVARVECGGLENLPQAGPLLIAGNHISLFDFLFLGSALGGQNNGLPVAPTFIIADKWRRCVHSYAAQLGNPIYIRRGEGDMDALGGALKVLESGGVVAIMPEGKPTRGALSRGKPGVAYLVAETLVPVLPVAIYGHDRFAQYWKRLRRVPVRIRIGEPFRIGAVDGSQADLQRKTDEIMRAIAVLMPSDYHGAYKTGGCPS